MRRTSTFNSGVFVMALNREGTMAGATKQITYGTPVMVGKIDILDGPLNTRCLDLFGMFNQESQEDRFDTVVMEATKILEDRLRKAANLDQKKHPTSFVAANGLQCRIIH